ncbi:NADPH-dependent 2,4-dienoyl-CoA reductase, sulfur reductase [Lachnospiraceae bacterium C7]|nr:NADPH-dependent 2,4-dienoyl-CoA reductase, sulfur reductase [Lachnospiraceae bacterium C7]
MSKTIIIGGVAAGAGTATRLRRLKEEEDIILFERGEYISYANCGLPYHVGDVIDDREMLLVTKLQVMKSRYGIDVRNNSEVVKIDRENKKVTVRTKGIEKKEYEESYDNLVIATGSSPIRPRIEGIDSEKIMTLWTVPDTDKIVNILKMKKAKKVAVVGGGFIGIEMTENLKNVGLEVSLIEAADQVMAPMDIEMAQLLHKNIRKNQIDLHLGDGVSKFVENENNITVELSSGKKITVDFVVLSIGVRPNSQLAKEAGLEINERGGIKVDNNLRTSDKNIYAAGDVIEVTDFIFKDKTMVPLAGPANKQARIVADNIAGIKSTYKGTQGSSIAKVFDYAAASTGANEKTLQKRGLVRDKDYKSIIITQNSHAAYYPGAKPLFLKLIFSMDGNKIFGAQIIGNEMVDKRIDTIATAIRFNASVFDLTELELSYAPPFSSAKDPVNMAGYVAENVINGYEDICEWDELEKNPEAVILDIREKKELEKGFRFEEGINIPLSKLREDYKKLDKEKNYVVFCGIGVRAYNASRILQQKGFKNVKIYPAGLRFYKELYGKN